MKKKLAKKKNQNYLSFYIALITTMTIFLGCVAGLNFKIDPAHIFQRTAGGYEKKLAKIILSGKNIANFSNCEERLMQRYLIDEGEQHDIVVFGSSRSSEIRSSFFKGQSFFNHSVSAGALKDSIALMEGLVIHGKLPKHVILEAEPGILNYNYKNGLSRWRVNADYLFSAMQRFGFVDESEKNDYRFDEGRVGSLRELFSWAYTLESLKVLREQSRHGKRKLNFATLERDLPGAIKLADGSLVPARIRRKKTSEKVYASFDEDFVNIDHNFFDNFLEMNKGYLNLLDSFLKDLRDKKIKVTLYFPPYHPKAYDRLMNEVQYRMIFDAKKAFENLAIKYGAEVLSSYSGREIGCSEEDFLDAFHPKEECLIKAFQVLKNR